MSVHAAQQHSTRRLSHLRDTRCPGARATVLAPCRKGDLVGSKGTRNHPFAPAERGPHCGEVLTSGPLACGVRPPRNSCFTSPTNAPSRQITSVFSEAHGALESHTTPHRYPLQHCRGQRSSSRDQERGPHTHTGPQRAILFTPPMCTFNSPWEEPSRASKREPQGEASSAPAQA